MPNLPLMSGLLARLFKTQPSEIDGLDVEEFVSWVDEAMRQQKAEKEAIDNMK